jgi:CheY-like chemotaxis protein
LPTILVADDNSNIQKMVILAFKGEGIDVVAVGNGEAAVKKTIEIVPDLVLADIFMPVRSGYEVCEFLKQDSRFSHVPVVLLAGAFDPFDEKEAVCSAGSAGRSCKRTAHEKCRAPGGCFSTCTNHDGFRAKF